jgi:hypothetical protein
MTKNTRNDKAGLLSLFNLKSVGEALHNFNCATHFLKAARAFIPANAFFKRKPRYVSGLVFYERLTKILETEHDLVSLTQVLNPEERRNDDFIPKTALGSVKFWDRVDQVLHSLDARGEVITLDHLRNVKRHDGRAFINQLVQDNHFAALMKISKSSGQRFSVDELTVTNDKQISIIDVLIKRNRLDRLFNERYWRGHRAELLAVYNNLDASRQNMIPFDELHARLYMLERREAFGLKSPKW